jgi:NAD(P)-dependent dehydrogenase (short-subunit alcohol dehydrogenase family)
MTVFITGAGSGIGRACAHKFASQGAHVFVNDLDPAKAQAVAKEVGGQAVPGDVAEPGPWLDPVVGHGLLHALVHNAGYDLSTPVGGTDMDSFKLLQRILVAGPFEITQRLLPNLKQAEGASVVFVASVHALVTEPGYSAYSAGKGAQLAMIRSMCQDLGPHKVRVVGVAPGYVDTPLLRQWIDSQPDPEATKAHADSLQPLGRIGRAEDIANLVAFLASPEAEFVNGVCVPIDGGLTARLYG